MGIAFCERTKILRTSKIVREKWCRSDKPEDFFEQIVLKKGSLFAE